MEYLDIYDSNGKHLGKEDRNIVHQKGLWHKTVHCWLYDELGNIYFQIRKEKEQLYTTSSGHVSAGETVEEAFDREVNEEIGLDTSMLDKEQIETVYFRMDRNKNGKMFIDRAFANIYICKISSKLRDFNFDPNEVLGLAVLNAEEAFDLLRAEKEKIKGSMIYQKEGKILEKEKTFYFKDFLINNGERGISKYGFMLERVISKGK